MGTHRKMLAARMLTRRLPSVVGRLAVAPASRGVLAPVAQRSLAFQEQREMSSAPTKLGSLGVDPLANSQTVQGVEFVLTGLDRLVNWARKSSMWPMTFGLA